MQLLSKFHKGFVICHWICYLLNITAEKMKFSIKNFFNKCDQIYSLRFWSHFLKKSLMENFIVCTVYACVISLKDITITNAITNAFQKVLDELGRKPNKIWLDNGSEFYQSSMKSWLEKHDIEIYSIIQYFDKKNNEVDSTLKDGSHVKTSRYSNSFAKGYVCS